MVPMAPSATMTLESSLRRNSAAREIVVGSAVVIPRYHYAAAGSTARTIAVRATAAGTGKPYRRVYLDCQRLVLANQALTASSTGWPGTTPSLSAALC